MRDHPSEPSAPKVFCARVAHCPVCGRPNKCRLETGEAYKGPCWCEEPTLSTVAVTRLFADQLEPRCLCQTCLQTIADEPEISWDALVGRRRASSSDLLPGDTYHEGNAVVFTEQYLLRRGYCCGNGCRHCPYGTAV